MVFSNSRQSLCANIEKAFFFGNLMHLVTRALKFARLGMRFNRKMSSREAVVGGGELYNSDCNCILV